MDKITNYPLLVNAISTGNAAVDEIGVYDFTGNIIPDNWYKNLTFDNGKPNFVAIALLSEVLYWYRPYLYKDEYTNKVEYRKKFKGDMLQYSYQKIEEKFRATNNQARAALRLLEKHGIVKRVFKTFTVDGEPRGNVLYIDLIPAGLLDVTFRDWTKDDSSTEQEEKPQKSKGKTEKKPGKSGKRRSTSDNAKKPKMTSKTKEEVKETKTEADTDTKQKVEEVKKNFKKLHFEDKDIIKFLLASHGDVGKVNKAYDLMIKSTSTITNPVGWILTAIKDGYEAPKEKPGNKSFSNFEQRDYDFDDIEKDIGSWKSAAKPRENPIGIG